MVSLLKVAQIEKADGKPVVLTGQDACKAKGSIDQSGVHQLYSSLNIASATDFAVGQTLVSFITVFSDDRWQLAGSGISSGSGAASSVGVQNKTASGGNVVARTPSTGASADNNNVGFVIHGELS